MASEQEIRSKIKLMEAVANDERAPQGERDAARNRAAAYKKKLPQPTSKPQVSNEEMLRMAAAFQNMGKQTTRMRATYNPDADWIARTNKAARDAAIIRERKRADAQKAWEAKNKGRDDMGRPTSKPFVDFDAAVNADPRTHAQKQQDISDRNKPRCTDPESFYDAGGVQRPRNSYAGNCDKCNFPLRPGEGAVFSAGGRSFVRCCESAPGPRKKRYHV